MRTRKDEGHSGTHEAEEGRARGAKIGHGCCDCAHEGGAASVFSKEGRARGGTSGVAIEPREPCLAIHVV